jgi:hypothetical protein
MDALVDLRWTPSIAEPEPLTDRRIGLDVNEGG